uniref:Elongator complex protein 1 n=1 Tax=Parastrongyloides trichosuri TaxID=131310 RepID=A0A0N4ZY50_PARTI
MKNIQFYEVISNCNSCSVEKLKDAEAFCFDSLSGIVYVSCPYTIYGFSLESKTITSEISWGKIRESRVEETYPKSFIFAHDENCIYAILANGDLCFISILSNEACILTTLVNRIDGVSWCPGNQCIICCSENKVFHFSREGNFMASYDLIPKVPGKDQLMTVGWGSRETQFQGSAGRKVLKEVDIEKLPTMIHEYDDINKVIISHRDDCEYLTISSVEETETVQNNEKIVVKERVMRIFNHENDFMAKCEILAGAEPVVAMKPKGNYIATLRNLKGKRTLRFYERNGQKRHDFDITKEANPEEKTIVSLSWNNDGTILSMVFKNIKTSLDEIQFWTVSNYDWTLKYCIEVPSNVIKFIWDEIKSNNFMYLQNNGIFISGYVDPRMYNVCNMNAVVVNGKELRVTDFNVAPIPPPMSLYQLQFPKPINTVAQHEIGNMVVLTSDMNLSLFIPENKKYKLVKIINLKSLIPNSENSFVYDIKFSTPDVISFIYHNGSYIIYTLNLTTASIKEIFKTEKNIMLHFNSVLCQNIFLIQEYNGDWYQFDYTTKQGIELSFNGKPVKLSTYDSHKSDFLEKECILISLTNTNQLLFNDKTISSTVGSYCVGDNFIIIITLSNTLFCLSRETLSKVVALPPDSAGRMVERGSHIVSFDSKGTRVWLQMPRGNLETIEPRTLLLSKMKQFFDKKEWKKAHREMRRHRIDMNLIFDHDPDNFMNNIPDFIDNIDDADDLNLFIMTLNDELTTTSMFSSHYPSHNGKVYKNKVNIICQNMLEYLIKIGEVDQQRMIRLFSCILSCYVKQTPTLLKEALTKIKNVMTKLEKEKSYEFLQDSLRHLLYMIDSNTLFKEAIGTYDWEIALNVAECSQRDPKEYISLLNDLRSKQPLSYQRFCADMYLDNYVSALNNIALTLTEDEKNYESHMEECINLIKLKNMYSNSLVVFKNSPHYGKICHVYGEYLESKGKVNDAAIMFLKCDDVKRAVGCYEQTKNWKCYLQYAGLINVSDDEINKILSKMAKLLETNGDHGNAYEIQKILFEKYGDEMHCKKMLLLLTTAGRWDDASLLVNNNRSLVELFKLKLKEKCDSVKKSINEFRSSYLEHGDRIVFLRNEKQAKIKELVNASMEDDGFEMQSEASSTISSFSKMSKISTASGRRKKTVEKKKKTIKHGSQYEDIGRLCELKKIYRLIDSEQDEMVKLLPILILWDFIEEGREIQKMLSDLLDEIEKNSRIYWPYYINAHHLLGPIHEIYRHSDGFIQMPDSGEMPERVAIEEELIPPKIRRNICWQLDMLK